MRRAELLAGTMEIGEAIEDSRVVDTLTNYRRVPRSTDVPPEMMERLFESLKRYTVRASQFSQSARQIAEIIGLNTLENPTIWTRLNTADGRPIISYDLHQTIKSATIILPKIADLFQPESITLIGEKADSKHKDKDVLTILIIEEDNRYSSPERLIKLLESVSSLYKSCATMNGLPPEGLSVIACDSGSDKSFDFFGLAKVIECVKEIIINMWDRVVFYKERQLAERITLVSQSLPVFDNLSKLAESKALAPEQAELIKRGLLAGISGFMESGSTIPEVQNFTHNDPRQLMAPEPKLLVAAPEDASTSGGGQNSPESPAPEESRVRDSQGINLSDEQDLGGLSDDERTLLSRLLGKLNRKEDNSTLSEQADSSGDDNGEE